MFTLKLQTRGFLRCTLIEKTISSGREGHMMISKAKTTKAIVGTGAAALVLGFAGAAGAQTYPDPDPAPASDTDAGDGGTDVRAVPLTPADSDAAPATPAATPVAQAPAVAAQQQQQLPVTGGDAAQIAIFGSILIAGGGLLVWRSKGDEAEA